MDLLVGRQHVIQLLHLLAPLPRQDPLEHRLRDSARLLQVEHLKALEQQLRRVGRRLDFPVECEELVEGDAVVGFVHGDLLGSPHRTLLVV